MHVLGAGCVRIELALIQLGLIANARTAKFETQIAPQVARAYPSLASLVRRDVLRPGRSCGMFILLANLER